MVKVNTDCGIWKLIKLLFHEMFVLMKYVILLTYFSFIILYDAPESISQYSFTTLCKGCVSQKYQIRLVGLLYLEVYPLPLYLIFLLMLGFYLHSKVLCPLLLHLKHIIGDALKAFFESVDSSSKVSSKQCSSINAFIRKNQLLKSAPANYVISLILSSSP